MSDIPTLGGTEGDGIRYVLAVLRVELHGWERDTRGGLGERGEALVRRLIERLEVDADEADREGLALDAIMAGAVSRFSAHYADPRLCPNKVSRGGENVCGCEPDRLSAPSTPVEMDTMAESPATERVCGLCFGTNVVYIPVPEEPDYHVTDRCPACTVPAAGPPFCAACGHANGCPGHPDRADEPAAGKCSTCGGTKKVRVPVPGEPDYWMWDACPSCAAPAGDQP